MMKNIFVSLYHSTRLNGTTIQRLSLFVFCLSLFLVPRAEDITGVVLDGDGQVLIGAEVFWEGTSTGTTTDVNGVFKLARHPVSSKLITAYLGYHNDTTVITTGQPLTIVLISDAILDEVTISAMKAAFLHSHTDVFNTTTLSAAQFCTAACCNLSESFENSASVDVSYSDAATGVKQIRLLGLSGKYVQMLHENTPGIRGLGQTFGLEFIPGPWMNSIQISKGTSSVINGYESLTGQINIELLKPHLTDPFAISAMINHEVHSELNIISGWQAGKITNGSLLFHGQIMPMQMDHNHDGFLDMPKGYQINLLNRWQTKKNNYTNQISVQAVYDKRTAGLTSKIQDKYNIDYDIDLRTKRITGFMKNGIVLNEEYDASLGIIVSGTYHIQKNKYGLNKIWDAKQTNAYLNAIFQTDLTKHNETTKHHHQLSTGLSINYDKYDENLIYGTNNNIRNTLELNRQEATPGVFAEYTYKFKDMLTLLIGIRGDYSTTYKFFVTPRMNIRYSPVEWLTLRANAGLGYRTPSIISDNSSWLASNKTPYFVYTDKTNGDIKTQNLTVGNIEQEKTFNTGITLSFYIPIKNKTLQLFAEYYYTNFLQGTMMDIDRQQATPYNSPDVNSSSVSNMISFYNLSNMAGTKAFSHTYQVEATMEVLRGWSLTLAFRYNDAKQSSYNNQTNTYVIRDNPLQSKYKAIITTTYQTKLKKWQFDLTAQFNGYGRMQDNFQIPDNSSQYYTHTSTLKNASGVPQQIQTVYHKWYPQLLGQVTRYFRNASVYLGAENMTNYTQNHPIQGNFITETQASMPTTYVNPYSENYDAGSVWAPIHGWKIYIGFRYNLTKD